MCQCSAALFFQYDIVMRHKSTSQSYHKSKNWLESKIHKNRETTFTDFDTSIDCDISKMIAI